MRDRFQRLYGDRPLQLVALLGCFLLAGYAATRVIGTAPALRIALWFVGAAIVWDLVLSPLLAGADAALRKVAPSVRLVNYVRVPVLLSALLLLLSASVVFQRSEEPYFAASGLTQDPYLERWLLVTALLFAASALAYAVAVLRSRARH